MNNKEAIKQTEHMIRMHKELLVREPESFAHQLALHSLEQMLYELQEENKE